MAKANKVRSIGSSKKAKSTVSKKESAKQAPSAKRPLAKIAKEAAEKVVSARGLDLDAILKNNADKMARATHNQERHEDMDGLTVRDALASRRVDARDIRYDLAKGFMTLTS